MSRDGGWLGDIRSYMSRRGDRLHVWGPDGSRFVLHVKQWALYHYIASLGDGTADADGWLNMTVQWCWFQSKKAEHVSKGSVLALSSGGWSLKRPFIYGSAALVPCLSDLLANALYNHLPHQVKREMHYKVYTRTSALSRVSPRAARSYDVYMSIFRRFDSPNVH